MLASSMDSGSPTQGERKTSRRISAKEGSSILERCKKPTIDDSTIAGDVNYGCCDEYCPHCDFTFTALYFYDLKSIDGEQFLHPWPEKSAGGGGGASNDQDRPSICMFVCQ